MQRYGYHRAFSMAGAGMIVSLVVFWGLRRLVVGRDKGIAQDVTGDPASLPRPSSMDAVSDSRRVIALIVIFLIVVVFWMIFHQNFSTLTYWANDNTNWIAAPIILELAHFLTLGTVKPDLGNVSGVISNAIDPFWIVVLTFPLVGFWRWLARKGKEPSTPAKMTVGMFLTAGAFYLMVLAALSGGDGGKVSPWWLISAYGVIALGELMLSPMGLSLVSKVAPARMRGLMMGGWFVATAIGNKLTAIGVYWQVWKHSSFFFVLATLALITGLVLFVLLKPLKKAMPGA
jgi:proton-dependent oligopeptide transporter, POT family